MTQVCEADVFPNLGVAADFDAQRLDYGDFRPDQFAGQAIARYAGVEHAGGLWLHFKDRGLEAHQGEIVSRGEPRRARTNDGDTFSCGFREIGVGEKLKQMAEFFEVVALARLRLALEIRKQLAACVAAGIAAKLFADKPLQRANRDGLVDTAPAARRLAGGAANAPAEGSERIGPTRYQISALVVSRSDGQGKFHEPARLLV